MTLHATILAGGRGERFWPLSRAARPKQVLPLVGERSLLMETVERACARVPVDRVWIVSAQDQRAALTSLNLPIPPARFLWEPLPRNTAPAIGAAAALVDTVGHHDPDALLLILPSDHWIPDLEAFWRSVERGRDLALAQDRIITFGVRVTRAETGYGYIERSDALGDAAYAVERFHEKPTPEVAQSYQSERFYWNAGIFLMRARTILDELGRHLPEIAEPLSALRAGLVRWRDDGEPGVGEGHGASELWTDYFRAAPAISIDYAVLERSERVAVVEAAFSWSDLGGWEAWGDLQTADAHGNRHAGDLLAQDAAGNIVFAEDGRLVALLGVRDLVVVQTGDATLVCPRDRVQEIRELVRRGKADERWKDRF